MEIGSVLHHFRVTRVRQLPELQATLWEMRHEGCGAQLAWLEREDENKSFGIAFKTLPEDSTGVFHILEHSVLCGSDRFPVKEPFVELLKSSVQTFLNAFTYPDKTVYPVSSRNDRDFLNLIDVYLDAVLHPAIYHKPEIFRQEGWRYEQNGDKTVYQGVVFNEMKGAFASPNRVLDDQMERLLYPDNCYSHCSGGDPACIPDLTYEQFIAQHQKYYHPSNARIFLCGSVDPDGVLSLIDGALAPYQPQPADFVIPTQAPVTAVQTCAEYEIGAEESTDGKTVAAWGKVFASFDEQEKIFAACVLADYLAGDNESPLKKAVLRAGLGQDLRVSVNDGIQQPYLSWSVWNTDRDKLPALRQTIAETLSRQASGEMDREGLRASFNRFAFRLRDRDGSGYPRSLLEGLTMLDSWLYGGDPAQPLLIEESLRRLEENLDAGLFEQYLKEWFLSDEGRVEVVLIPSRTLGEEKRKKEAQRVASECAAWTEERKAEVKAQGEALAQWQQTPDSEEALATIPLLQLSDLAPRPRPIAARADTVQGTPVLRHTLESELLYCNLFFGASDLAAEELPYLALLSELLGRFGTEKRDGAELQRAVKTHIGKLSFDAGALPGSRTDSAQVRFSASLVCLAEQKNAAADLVCEILTSTQWQDRALLREILKQAALDGQMSLASAGHRYAISRAGAYQTAHGAVAELLTGYSYLSCVNRWSNGDDETLDGVLARLGQIARKLFTAARLTVSVSEKADDALIHRLIASFPAGDGKTPVEGKYAPLGTRQEGIQIPAAVAFAVEASSLPLHGKEYNGSIPVLANILNYNYLWNVIRVQGGAYGCGFIGRDAGDLFYYTYRDPQPGRSLGCFDEAEEFVRSFCASSPDLTKYILGSVTDLDPLLNAGQRMNTAENRWFRGITDETVCRRYTDLIRTTPADLLALCGALKDLKDDRKICVVGGPAQLDACDRLATRLSGSFSDKE